MMSVPTVLRAKLDAAFFSNSKSPSLPASRTASLPCAAIAFNRASTAGRRNPRVFPVPVFALTSRSRGGPVEDSWGSYGRASSGRRGNTCACTGDMVVIFIPFMAFSRPLLTIPSRVSNVGKDSSEGSSSSSASAGAADACRRPLTTSIAFPYLSKR